MPTLIEQSHEAQSGDLIAYTIGEEGAGDAEYDIAIAGAENTVPDTSTLRAVLAGEFVSLEGEVTFEGADPVLNFALPEGLRPLVDQTIPCLAYDDSAALTKPARLYVAAAGDVEVEMCDGSDFAAGDIAYLNGSYLRA